VTCVACVGCTVLSSPRRVCHCDVCGMCGLYRVPTCGMCGLWHVTCSVWRVACGVSRECLCVRWSRECVVMQPGLLWVICADVFRSVHGVIQKRARVVALTDAVHACHWSLCGVRSLPRVSPNSQHVHMRACAGRICCSCGEAARAVGWCIAARNPRVHA
jgi:hypothetical protein